jgi:Kef-type K+ transport system membrane component KefB
MRIPRRLAGVMPAIAVPVARRLGLGSVLSLPLGLSWQAGLAVGLTLAMSSTAIVLQTLNEKGLMKTSAGQNSFAVLL